MPKFSSSKASFFIILLLLIISNFLWIYSTRDRIVLSFHKARFPYHAHGLNAFEKGISKCFLAFNSFERTITGPDEDPWDDSQVNKRIMKYRTAKVSLIINNAAGKPLSQLPVTICQVRHKFLFGGRIDPVSFFEENTQQHLFEEIFNYATLPFFWGLYEGIEGQTDYNRIRAIANWCNKRRIATKGHPLIWQLVVPWWLWVKKTNEVEASLWFRVQREVKEFATLIDKWDVVNEPSTALASALYGYSPICRLYHDIGRLNLLEKAFAIAHKSNPRSTLVLNDFVVGDYYKNLIADCLESGVEIDVIGLQSHMHKKIWSLDSMWDVCERFSHFGKPLHFTEITVLSGKLMSETDEDWYNIRNDWSTSREGERRQTEAVRKFYRLLFSHPAVEAITWWGFSDAGSWMGAPAGLLRKDMSPKPVYGVLKKLIKDDWWTGPLKLKTDYEGRISFRGFLGDYVIESEKGRAQIVIDQAGKIEKTIHVTLP